MNGTYLGNNVKHPDIALYSGYYVQISDSIEKEYWWICIGKTKCQVKYFEQSHSPEKYERGTLRDFQTSIMFQNIKKNEGGTLWYNQKTFEKKSHSGKKYPS